MPELSAVIIAFNEEKYIGRCLSSLHGVADEIVVIDSLSTDSTSEICRSHNVRFISHPFEGYVQQKNYALAQASNDLVLSLDADEALSDELKKSILEVKQKPVYDGYKFNRLNNYCGKWIRHSRFYPDRQLRLFDRTKGRWAGFNPHDKFQMNDGAKVKWLKGDILHWNYDSIDEHISKMNRFSTISALELYKAGRRAGIMTGIFHMIWTFFRSYIWKAGFLDGYYGFIICSIASYGSFLKYAKLRKMADDARSKIRE